MKCNLSSDFNKMPAWAMGVLLLLCSFSLHAQTFTKETPYLTTIDVKTMGDWLANAPMELAPEAKSKAIVTDLPLPGGGTVTVRVEKSLIAPQEVYDRLPDIMTYSFQGTDDPSIRGRLTLSPKGVEAIMSTKDGDVYIEAESYGSALHKVFYKKANDFPHSDDDARYPDGFEHKHTPDGASHQHEADPVAKMMMMSYNIGAIRREFRMHVIADKEYSVALCGANPTRSCVEMAIMTAVNSMNGFYTPEMAVKLNLTANTTIYLTGNPSGFAAGGGMSNPEWIDESVVHHLFLETNQTGHDGTTGGTDNAIVARNSYDVGHLFSGRVGNNLGGGGAAYLQGVCNDVFVNGLGPIKAGGGSGVSNPQGAGWIDLLSHEFTHQFNADHTFSASSGNCANPNQFNGNTSFEPGGGSTIVSYAQICPPQNIPNLGNISYYHTHSIKQVDDWIEGPTATCESNVNSGNSVPVPNANPCGASFNMPTRTPFEITGSATDANDPATQLTYCWEQYNNAPNAFNPIDGPTLSAGTAPDNFIYPIFRSRFPSSSPSRTFPQLDIIASGNYNGDAQTAATLTLNNWQGELLPEIAGKVTLRLTVRDNNTTSGGVEFADATINFVNTGAPFALTAPNSGTLTAGNATTITWNVAGTTAAPISCANVAIKLSIDGGLTYPFTLAASTANDGTESVTIPNTIPNTTTARIRVECGTACFKFFDISNSNVTITSDCPATTNNICPTTAMSFSQGNAGLNLALNNYFGAPITSNAFNLTANSPTGPLANATVQNGNTCQTAWGGTENYEVLDFAVSATGNYTFGEQGGQTVVASIFLAAGYNPAMPCAGTFIGSNSFGAIGGITSSKTVSLTACTAYKMVVWTVNQNYGTKTINISGAGSVYKSGVAAPTNTGYTYVAVNTTNNQVAVQNATANFTTLTAGSYQIYGVSYKNGGPTPPPNADPSTWIGQTVETILANNCAVFSSNFKLVTVTGSANNCTPNLMVTGNVTSNTYRSQGDLTANNATVANGATVQFISDSGVLLNSNVTIELGAIFDALIQACTQAAPENNKE
ncbi:MAG: M12 family metallo-peptidase [Saprospiraceae bacterium]